MTTLAALQSSDGVRLQTVVAIEGIPHLITDGDTDAALTAWGGPAVVVGEISSFEVQDEWNAPATITVPIGTYTQAELIALIQAQLPDDVLAGWVFDIVGGYAQFSYPPSVFLLTWTTTSLRDLLGYTGDVSDWAGLYTGTSPVIFGGVSSVSGEWPSCLGGLDVRWNSEQQIRPWSTELSISSVSFAVQDADGNDTFGKMVGAVAGGTQTLLATSLNLTFGSVVVKRIDDFETSGEIHVSTECMGYDSVSVGDDTFLVTTRGKYSPFASQAGNYSHAHHVPATAYGVSTPPTVSSQPSTWIGRWVEITIHRVVGGVLDPKADALRAFAGRITDVRDDANGLTWIECDDVRAAIKDTVLMRDQFTAQVREGFWLVAGSEFRCHDSINGGSLELADPLRVVATGASGTNEINEGRYTYEELCSTLNAWLAAERDAFRLNHWITLSMDQASGPRTKISASHPTASTGSIDLKMSETCWRFLGFGHDGFANFTYSSQPVAWLSTSEPYRRLTQYGDLGPGGIRVEIAGTLGTWFANEDHFPAEMGTIDGADWGVVQWGDAGLSLVRKDGDALVVGSTDAAPFLAQLSGPNLGANLFNAKWSADGGVSLRQVAILGGSFKRIVMQLLASTGTATYNSSTYDVLPAQLGAAIPWDLISGGIETDLASLGAATSDLLVVVEKPTKLTEVLGADLLLRAAWFVWRAGQLRIATWGTPTAATALHTLTEANKAAPAGSASNERTIAQLTDEFLRNVIKVEFNRLLKGTGDEYTDSVTIVDSSTLGSGERVVTIKARNTFGGVQSSLAAVEAQVSYLGGLLPMWSRGLRILRRSVDLSLFHGVAPGDQCTLTDNHVRDAVTGERGVIGKPGLIIGHNADLGGYEIDAQAVRPMVGEIDVVVWPRDRFSIYAPCAEVDETITNAGYDAATRTLTFKAHAHSEVIQAVDVSHFAVNDNVRIVEIDPAVPASATTWTRVVQAVDTSANTIQVTVALSSPSWDSAKRYRLISASYDVAAATQQTDVYQADDVDGLILDTAEAYEYGHHASAAVTWTDDDPKAVKVALTCDLAFGDGAPLDTGYERDLARLVNNLAGIRTAPSVPLMTTSVMKAGVTCVRKILAIVPVVLGPGDLLSGDRVLWVEPWLRSASGTSTLRVSLCRGRPVGSSLILTDADAPEYVLVGPFESNDWNSSSTTWAPGAAYGFSLRNLTTSEGAGFLVVEGTEHLETRGASAARCGPYTEAA